MAVWDNIYSEGSIHKIPSKEIVGLIPSLKADGVIEILDAGCGTGRHSRYLAQMGFNVHGFDISEKAIKIAESDKNGYHIDYRLGTLSSLPYASNSMDFILANHSLEYGCDEDIRKYIIGLDGILKKGKPIFVRVVSKQHPFYEASPEEIYGFSHVGFCIKNYLPVHFFSEDELKALFKGYDIKRLEHVAHKADHDKITIPLAEWILLAYKQ